MKNLKNILIGCACVMGLGSCSDLLDIEPVNSMVPETVNDFEALLLSGYPASDYCIKTEIMTDNVMVNARSASEISEDNVPWFTWAESHQYGSNEYDPYWGQLYSSIYYANTIIDKYKGDYKGSKDDELCEIINGEAHVLRAWSYFYLANLYSQPYSESTLAMPCVPVILSSENNLDYTEGNTRESIEVVWNLIVDDLNKASVLLKSKPSKGKYRFNYLSTEAFKSRVFLHMNRLNESIEAANNVMASAGIWDMNNLPDIVEEGKPSLQFFTLERGLVDTGYKEDILFFTGGQANNRNPFRGAIKPDTTFLNEFIKFDEKIIEVEKNEAGDTIKDENGEPKTFVAAIIHKVDYRRYIYETQDFNGTGIDPSVGKTSYNMYANQTPDLSYYIGMKTGEVLLNRAEAYARLGKKTEALSDLEFLWERRFKESDYEELKDSMLKENDILKVVLSERRKETAFDGGLRWFDLRRTDKKEITHDLPSNHDVEITTYTLKQGDLRYVLQIPISEQQKSPNMELNPRD